MANSLANELKAREQALEKLFRWRMLIRGKCPNHPTNLLILRNRSGWVQLIGALPFENGHSAGVHGTRDFWLSGLMYKKLGDKLWAQPGGPREGTSGSERVLTAAQGK